MDVFQRFCERYLSHFDHKPGSLRTIGVEKEILLTDHEGKMADATKSIWPHLQKQNFDSFNDSVYKDQVCGFYLPEGIITTDAGRGTFEVILEPHGSVQLCEEKMKALLAHLLPAAEAENLYVVGLGMQPLTEASRSIWNKKQRYEILIGHLGDDILTSALSAADQAHIDMGADEFTGVLNTMTGLAGFMMVLFSNSPVKEGAVSKPQVYREVLWDNMGNERTGLPDRPWESVEDYLDYTWDLTCIFGKEGDHYFDPNASFRDFVKDKNEDELFDAYCLHEGTIWFCGRPRVFGTIETRPTCLQPWQDMMTVPAFLVGAVEAWQELESFLGDFEWKGLQKLRYDAAREGFALKIKGKPVAEFLKEILDIVKVALMMRSQGEEKYLQPLYERVVAEQAPADKGILLFEEGGAGALVKSASLRQEHLLS